MPKTKNLFIIGIVLAAIIIVLNIIVNIINYQVKKQDETNYIYKITYDEDYEPGSQTTYFLYTDGNIKVKSTVFCGAIDCEPTVSELEDLDFSKENLKLTYHYLLSLTNGKKETTIKNSDIYNDDKKISIFSYINRGEEQLLKLEIDDYQYKLEVGKENNYHLIYLKDNTVNVANLYYENYDLKETKIHKLKFNETNTKIIKEFITKQFDKDEIYSNTYYGSLEYKDKIIVDSIISNNESLLKDIESQKTLKYKLSYFILNCLTPELHIYDDSSYELYNTFTTSGKTPTPVVGKYNYDLNKLINASIKQDNPDSAFMLTNDNETYYYETTNTTLNEFLTSAGLTTSDLSCSLIHER